MLMHISSASCVALAPLPSRLQELALCGSVDVYISLATSEAYACVQINYLITGTVSRSLLLGLFD